MPIRYLRRSTSPVRYGSGVVRGIIGWGSRLQNKEMFLWNSLCLIPTTGFHWSLIRRIHRSMRFSIDFLISMECSSSRSITRDQVIHSYRLLRR